ncbi:MAG TPA: SPFH domain-containing protein [Myxococcaceae bacterium]|nr:SPFH domain-containing protein [Myxococcaceae bacterium]
MGLFDALKQESQRNFIARADEAKNDILYTYPEHNVRMLTQLTVGADEVALFVKDGTVQGRLGPGRHQLDSNNIPFLGRLVEKLTGGNLFVAELYFVSTREFPGVKFGGPIGDVRDPETGLGIGTMVYGDFSVRVTDPEKLVVGLVGLRRTSNDEFLAWFKSQLLKTVRDRVGELLVKKRWALLDVTSGAYTEEIEQEVLAGVKPHVDGYGLTVVRLGNVTISIKPEDEATLKRLTKDQAYSKMAGGFQQYAAGQAMLGAAEGMAKGGGEGGGGVLQGAALGVGMGMAQALQQAQGAARPAAAGPVGTPCPKCGTPGSGKFCSNCGSPLVVAQTCAKCGSQLQPAAKFCGSCGQPTTG